MTESRARRPQVPLAQRRAELAEAALQVMRRDGAWTMTTRAVATEAGVPHGTVHYAFSSKEALLQAVVQADTDFAVQYFAAAARSGGSPGEVLAQAFAGYAERVIDDPQTELVLQELSLMAARDPALGQTFAPETDGYRQAMAGLLSELAARTDGRWDAPMDVLVEHVLATLFGLSASWLLHRDDQLLRSALSEAARATAERLRPT